MNTNGRYNNVIAKIKDAWRVIIRNRDFGYPWLKPWGGEIAPFVRKIIKYLTNY